MMDSHRSFEFDRYPFDDAVVRVRSPEAIEDGEGRFAEDITHGMEIVEAMIVIREDHVSFNQP